MNLSIEINNINDLNQRLREANNIRLRNELLLAVKESIRDVREYARSHHRFRSSTGELERSIESEILNNTMNPEGEVFLNSAATMTESGISYGEILHRGVNHSWKIQPRFKKCLRWESNDAFYFANQSEHGPIQKDEFIYNAARLNRDNINNIFNRHINTALNNLT